MDDFDNNILYKQNLFWDNVGDNWEIMDLVNIVSV
jgi:hypothetical protein